MRNKKDPRFFSAKQLVRLEAALDVAKDDPEFKKLCKNISFIKDFFAIRNIREWKILGIQNFDNLEN